MAVVAISGVVMARHIAPTYFGLIAIYSAIVLAAGQLSSLGFGTAIIQNHDQDDDTHSSVFYVVVSFSVLAFVILGLATDFFIKFYGRPNYQLVFSIIALRIILDKLVIIHSARCVINLDLKFINIVKLTKDVGSAIVGLALVFAGYELVALATQLFVQSFIRFFMFAVWRPWFPKNIFNRKKLKKLFQFGVYIYLAGLLNNVYKAIQSTILGANYSAHIYAQINKARVANVIVNQNAEGYFHKIIFPYLSGPKEENHLFQKQYFNSMKLVSFLSCFVGGVLFFVGSDLVLLIYGDQWHEAARWIKIICLNLIFIPIIMAMNVGVLSKGFAKEIFVLSIMMKILSATILISSFYVTVPQFLILAVIFGFIATLIQILFNSYYLQFSISKHFMSIQSAMISFMAGLITTIVFTTYGLSNHFVINALIFTSLFVLTLFYFEKTFILKIVNRVLLHFKFSQRFKI